METCNFGGFFTKNNVYFITGMPFFLLLPLDNDFLQTFWAITAYNNEELPMKHWEKILCEAFWKVFLVFFASISPDTMVTWMQNVFSNDAPP